MDIPSGDVKIAIVSIAIDTNREFCHLKYMVDLSPSSGEKLPEGNLICPLDHGWTMAMFHKLPGGRSL